MPRRVEVVPHLTPEELAAAIEAATDPVQRRRLQAIQLVFEYPFGAVVGGAVVLVMQFSGSSGGRLFS